MAESCRSCTFATRVAVHPRFTLAPRRHIRMPFRRTILAIGLAAGLMAADSTDPAKVLMEAARKKEVVDGDLSGAIQQYKAVVARYAANRAVAAQALLRLAECYQKMGDSESRK